MSDLISWISLMSWRSAVAPSFGWRLLAIVDDGRCSCHNLPMAGSCNGVQVRAEATWPLLGHEGRVRRSGYGLHSEAVLVGRGLQHDLR